ncbi:MAG TPA: hypothetical protein VF691_00920 [Cytophagaceae bacterium]|jgi:hypothetical protein
MYLLLFSCSTSLSDKERAKTIVKHVFTSGKKEAGTSFKANVRSDYYYVYNYEPKYFPLIFKILDTITFDTSYKFHSHIFKKYDENLPDTSALKRKMEDPYSDLESAPGDREFSKYMIVDILFSKGGLTIGDELSPPRLIPDHYVITTRVNKLEERFYIKDTLSGKLREVDYYDVYPADSKGL